MNKGIVIIGAGGFGREVFGIIQALRRQGDCWEIVGFVDDAPTQGNHELTHRLGSGIIGPVSALRSMTGIAAVVGIGSSAIRETIAARLDGLRLHWPTLVHPDATVGEDVTLDPGTVIAAGARLSTNISCGRHVQIDQNVTVGHDVRIGEFSRLNPQACVSGNVSIGGRVLIGANSSVLQGLRVGRDAVVGAGAVVVKNVTAAEIVVGIPARPLRSNDQPRRAEGGR